MRTLAGACCTALSALAGAQQAPSQSELDLALQEALKLDRQIPTPGTLVQRPDKRGARELWATEIEGINQKRASAKGRVRFRQGDMEVRAEQVEYDAEQDLVRIPGTVEMRREGDRILGESLQLKIEQEVGTLANPRFYFSKTAARPSQRYEARGEAREMRFEGADHERFFDTRYTTCKPGEDDWYLKVSELALDRATNTGTGYHGRIEFMGTPILYLPYMTFPLNNERKSGFLAPTFGSSSKSGLEISLPYYLNLAPHYDATLTPKLFSRRGMQLGAEFRYLGRDLFGQLDSEYLPGDRVAGRDRYLVAGRHYQNLAPWSLPGWSAALNAQKVSDDNYFRDLSTKIANTAQTNLPREAALNYGSPFGSFGARVLAFQTLQDPAQPVVAPYRLAPQITFQAQPARWNRVEFNTVGEYTDFMHPTLVNGRRLLLYPSFALPLATSYGFVTPKVGYHATRYDLTRNTTGFEGGSRNVPIVSLDSGITFERTLAFATGAVTQTLEPRLFFLYVPFRDQSKLPRFTTSETDFSFAQIFNENLFIGGDRISDAKQMTAAVTTRFIQDATGIERLRAAIGQRYYFRPQQVTLTGSALGLSGLQTGDISRSDLLAAVSGQLSDHWTLDSGFQYSTSDRNFKKSNVSARYQDLGGRLLNLSYRFTRDSIHQADISTQMPLGRAGPGWTLLARSNYSIRDRKLLEGLVGLEYNHGCWEFRLVAHRFTTAAQQYSNSVQFQLELKGLSKLGINPLETLRQNIAGYRRSDER
ncbi:MAG: LPS-assembly protein LptD [Betaproteobacteria bacterium]|nr:LPS-assembly protein LptD [Betaproteobacteria bacterium]